MRFYFIKDNEEFFFSTNKETLFLGGDVITKTDLTKYFKGVYSNKERFMGRYVTPLRNAIECCKDFNLPEWREQKDIMMAFIDGIVDLFDKVDAFTFKQAFAVEEEQFRMLVFGSISVPDMIKELGSIRIKTDGIAVKQKKFNEDGEMIGWTNFENIYETYEVFGAGLGLRSWDKIYAVKCWCTSTNKEHWIWIEGKYKDDPLSAIASTFRVHENIIPYIKEIKRHGDVLILEMKEQIGPKGKIVPLTKEQYFGLLTAQG